MRRASASENSSGERASAFDQAAAHEEAQHAALDDSLDGLDFLRAEPSRLIEVQGAVIAPAEEAIEHHELDLPYGLNRLRHIFHAC